MANQLILAPPIAFLVFLLVGAVLDRVGCAIADERSGDGAFRTAYGCGEHLVGKRTQPKYKLYHVGIGFTVIHLAVLLIATMPTSGTDAVGTAAIGVTLLAVVALSLFALVKAGLKP
jgi:hypothetical protein